MRRPSRIFAAAVGVAVAVASPLELRAQQPLTPPNPAEPASSVVPVSPGRTARHLLRNGQDFLKFRQFNRALELFQEAQGRQAELTPAEQRALRRGLELAWAGLNGTDPGPEPIRPEGQDLVPSRIADLGGNGAGLSGEPGQLLPGTTLEPPPPVGDQLSDLVGPMRQPHPVALPPLPLRPPTQATSIHIDPLLNADGEPTARVRQRREAERQAALVPPPVPTPSGDSPLKAATSVSAPLMIEVERGRPSSFQMAGKPIASRSRDDQARPVAADDGRHANGDTVNHVQASTIGNPSANRRDGDNSGALTPILTAVPSQPPAESRERVSQPPPPLLLPDRLPPLPNAGAANPSSSANTAHPTATPAPAGSTPRMARVSRPDSLPVQPGEPAPTQPPVEVVIPPLPAEVQAEIDRIARVQEERRGSQPPKPAGGLGMFQSDPDLIDDTRSQSSLQLNLPRPPSPTEARPLRAVPAVEDTALPAASRQWKPYRKYWAAAATNHTTLYFQDPVLERYGQSMEAKLGRVGEYLSYPLDKPSQTNQRGQIAQPFFSFGLFGVQMATLPYRLIVNPPWEHQYDLGYYRPGDPVPPDLYYFPLGPINGSEEIKGDAVKLIETP